MNRQQLNREVLTAIRKENYKSHGDGVISLLNDGIVIRGEYTEGSDLMGWRTHKNLLTDQGIIHILNVNLGSVAKISTWYLAPFAGATTPAGAWTAANFTSNSTEITSGSEGYSESVRQTYVTADATSSDQIDNYASKAAFTIVTASSLSVTGLGLLSVSTKGGTTGVLLSASKFTSARVLQNTDVWNAGYRVALATA